MTTTTTKKAAARGNGKAAHANGNESAKLVAAVGQQMALIEFDLDGVVLTANENFLKTAGTNMPWCWPWISASV